MLFDLLFQRRFVITEITAMMMTKRIIQMLWLMPVEKPLQKCGMSKYDLLIATSSKKSTGTIK